MPTNNQNRIGYFVLVNGEVWKITGCLVNCLSEQTEYECHRLNRVTGLKERRIFRKGDKLISGIYKTRERAEIAKQNVRINELEERLDSFVGIVNEFRQTYNLL